MTRSATTLGTALAAGIALLVTGASVADAAPTASTKSPSKVRTVVVRGKTASFVTPSGNISCLMDKTPAGGTYVRCDILARTWKAPKRPRSCDLDWGSAIVMSGLLCAGDTVGMPTLGEAERQGWFTPRVGVAVKHQGAYTAGLRYGNALRLGDATCSSTTQGVTCTARNKHGFFVSKSMFRTF